MSLKLLLGHPLTICFQMESFMLRNIELSSHIRHTQPKIIENKKNTNKLREVDRKIQPVQVAHSNLQQKFVRSSAIMTPNHPQMYISISSITLVYKYFLENLFCNYIYYKNAYLVTVFT